MVAHRTIQVDGLSVFYREAGDPASPKLLLLGGFPASSHQFRNLIPALADRFHVLSPDYPGFGNTDMPDDFEYTFDRLSEIVEGLLEQTGFHPFGLYHQDYGGPIGNRIVGAPPGLARVAGDPELERLRGGLHRRLGRRSATRCGSTAAPRPRRRSCRSSSSTASSSSTRTGTATPSGSAPTTGTWTSTSSSGPARAGSSSTCFYDYRTNVELYPQWQAFLRERRPETLILWGENDIFFTPEGGRAYLRDLPDAELHMLDTGHFAVEDSLEEIAAQIKRFHAEQVDGRCATAAPVRAHAMRVLSVNVGLPREVLWRGRPVTTGIFKEPVAGRVPLRRLNLDGDRQADLRVHGGPDKAVYAYPSEFYELWSRERPELDVGPGTFGENLTHRGPRSTATSASATASGSAPPSSSSPSRGCRASSSGSGWAATSS